MDNNQCTVRSSIHLRSSELCSHRSPPIPRANQTACLAPARRAFNRMTNSDTTCLRQRSTRGLNLEPQGRKLGTSRLRPCEDEAVLDLHGAMLSKGGALRPVICVQAIIGRNPSHLSA